MKVKQLVPAANKRVQFNLRFRKFVPQETGCYVLATFEDEVLYIGLTNNLYQRFFQHRDNKEKRNPVSARRAFWFYYLTCAEKEAYRIERTWLNEHVELHGSLPILNKINSPVS
jgi:predicted GIY-YIG superfamily endonuclease